MTDHATLNAIFLQIGNLPQCQTVALGDGTSGAGFVTAGAPAIRGAEDLGALANNVRPARARSRCTPP